MAEYVVKLYCPGLRWLDRSTLGATNCPTAPDPRGRAQRAAASRLSRTHVYEVDYLGRERPLYSLVHPVPVAILPKVEE